MELTIERALQRGVAAHREGKLKEAERLYRTILQTQPMHPDANHNLGLIEFSMNNSESALTLFKTALEINPKIEQFWFSYIGALIKEKQFNNAKRVIEKGRKKGINEDKLDALETQFSSVSQGTNPIATIPSQQALDSLLEHYQAERYGDAEKFALSITRQFPKHEFGWKILGAVYSRTGRKSDAVNINQKVVALSPRDAEARYNLGNTLRELGRLEEAETSYTRAIALRFDLAEAHGNLGVTLQRLNRLEEAELSYRQAIVLKPDYAEVHNNLGVTLRQLGRLEEAEASYRQAIKGESDFAEAYSNLGVTLQDLNRLEEAEASHRQATMLKSDFAEAYYNLGNTLRELGRLVESEASYTQAIVLNSEYAEAYNNLGNILQELGRFEEAEASYRQATVLQSDYAEAHNNLGVTLRELERLEEAETSYREAIRLKFDFAEAYSNLGVTLQELGRLEEAEAKYRQAITLKPDYAEAHRLLALMKTFDIQDEQYSIMRELYSDEKISEEQLCHINFGLAKASEDIGNIEQAFKHYCEGNALCKKLLNYDISEDIEFFKELKTSYPQIQKSALEIEILANNPMPIFIIGMPRSGTTLVEQIISSHSQVTGAGELDFVAQFGEAIARGLTLANTNTMLNFRENYLQKLKTLSNGKPFVTDKMPQNFRYLGLLVSSIPEAKIVHVKRSPPAVCWAHYKLYFSSKMLNYSYELDDIAQYYRLYENLMNFWTESFANRIYDLDYELLTVNQAEETTNLIHHLGLDWEEECLLPQNNVRSVSTASNMQVRKKLYQGSSQDWKKFKPFLNGRLDFIDL